MDKPKVVTTHVCPPIPLRHFDWVAYIDGEEEFGPYGYGETEALAIESLKQCIDESWPVYEKFSGLLENKDAEV